MMPVFNPEKILFTPDALNGRGLQITSQYPDAEQVAIKQHNKPPDIDISHFKAKSDLLILGKLKTQACKWSGRSSDYIAPSLANGCFGGCAYCYVDRHKKINPI